MKNVLAIDPGPTESGWVLINSITKEPLDFGKSKNDQIKRLVNKHVFNEVVIEKPVCQRYSGASISDTALHAGILAGRFYMHPVYFITRSKVRGVLCGRSGNDSNVIREMVSRFAPWSINKGKGSKSDPGFFYGFAGDVWQAFALGVVFLDMIMSGDKKDEQYLNNGRI